MPIVLRRWPSARRSCWPCSPGTSSKLRRWRASRAGRPSAWPRRRAPPGPRGPSPLPEDRDEIPRSCPSSFPPTTRPAACPPSLERIIAYFDTRSVDYELLVVDDGSSDETAARRGGDHRLRLGERGRVLRNPQNLGKGASVRRGMLAARGARVLFSDADLSAPIEELPKLEQALDAGAGVAIGSRARGPRRSSRSGSRWPRSLMGRLFNLVVQLFAVRGHQRHPVRLQALRRRGGEPDLRAHARSSASGSTSRCSRWRSAWASRSPRCRSAGATAPARASRWGRARAPSSIRCASASACWLGATICGGRLAGPEPRGCRRRGAE